MWEIKTEENLYSFSKLWIVNGINSHVPAFVKGISNRKLVMEEVPLSTAVEIPPTLEMPHREFDDFINAWAKLAWGRGWRPEDYIPSSSTLLHLEDMRKIVAKKIGVEL